MKINKIDLNKECGYCPYCKGVNYNREDYDLTGDIIIFNCFCDGCNKGFKETFELVNNSFEVEK